MSKQHDQFEHWCQSAQKRIECLERSNAALRGHLKRAKMKRYGVTGAYSISKIEKGVMIIKGDKAWGIIYEYGQPTTYGWVAPRDAGKQQTRRGKIAVTNTNLQQASWF